MDKNRENHRAFRRLEYERKFQKKTGNFMSDNPLDIMDDNLMRQAPAIKSGNTLDDTGGPLHRAAPGQWNQATQDDYERVLRGEPLQTDWMRTVFKEWGVDPDHLLRLTRGRREKLANKLVRLTEDMTKKRDADLERELDVKRTGGLGHTSGGTRVPAMSASVIERLGRPLKMEKPQGSSFHHLLEYAREREESNATDEELDALSETFQIFVIEHDWASAFKGSGDFTEGEVPLPYDYTCFEMRVNGMRVLVLTRPDRACTLAIGLNDEWICSGYSMEMDGTLMPRAKIGSDKGKSEINRFLDLVRSQIRAVCIMLDADVVEREVRRAPEKLNRVRERSGRTPLRDFHVLRLAHRHRVKAADMRASPLDPDYTRKRLHFRRGHDRHYANYKVWIKWQLVGDPDLGFVDKEYRL